MTPVVSVIIPAHNMADTIAQSVQSALCQTYTHLEVIVVDDASADGTTDILAGIPDPRLRVIRMSASGGPSAARNAGIRAACSHLIAFLDADDVWLSTKLAKQVALFEQDSSLGLAYCGAYIVDQSLRYLRTQATGEDWPPPGEEAFRRIVLRHSFIAAPLSSMVLRKACLDDVGLFDEDIIQAEEWDLAFRLAYKWRIGFVPEPLVLYRMTGHFNPEKRLSRRIGQAHETTVQRAFARLGDPPELESLKTQALLETWWGVALYLYAVQRPDQANAELEKIAALDTEYLDFQRNPHLRTSVAYVAWGLYDTITPLKEALAFVDYVFDHWPSAVRFRNTDRRSVKAEVAAITAFDSFPRCERGRVVQSTSLALLLDPSLLRNRGLLKLPLRTLTQRQAITTIQGAIMENFGNRISWARETEDHTRNQIKYLQLDAERDRFVYALASQFPEITVGSGKRALDLGCGSSKTPGDTQRQLDSCGYTWVGVDMTIGRASLLADGHFLPFQDQSFDLVVSIAALEHMRKPWLVARELGRVTRTGALFLGTTAFLEAEHTKSYFHMSHLGVESFLDEAGFEIIAFWPGWTAQNAMAWFTFVEGGGKKQILYQPFRQIGSLYGTAMQSVRSRRLHSDDDYVIDQLRFSGSIGFAARKR